MSHSYCPGNATAGPAGPPDGRPQTGREDHRLAVIERFVTALEDVASRYRVFIRDGELADLCAEVITAEVAHHLCLTRAALHRHPPLTRHAAEQTAPSPASASASPTPPSPAGRPDEPIN